jgi:hypothetical protein
MDFIIIITIPNCKTCQKRLLDVEYVILTVDYYQMARTRELYTSTDVPAGQHADDPPNSDQLTDIHRCVPVLMVLVN